MQDLTHNIKMKIKTFYMFLNMIEHARSKAYKKNSDNRMFVEGHDKITSALLEEMPRRLAVVIGRSPSEAFETVFDLKTSMTISELLDISLDNFAVWYKAMHKVIKTYDNYRHSPRLNRRGGSQKYVYIGDDIESDSVEALRVAAEAANMKLRLYGQGPSWTRNKIGNYVYGVRLCDAAVIVGQMIPKA